MGYRRIHGELTKLDLAVALSTVWEILHAAGLDPPVRADNPVHGSDQHSCPASRPAVMITDHVPAVRVRHEALLFRMEVRDRPSPCRRSGGVKLEAA